MRNKILVSVVMGVLFFSCKKEEKQPEEVQPEPQVQEVATNECYEYVKGKDTITANFIIQNKTVSGDLTYAYFEKDKNSGTIVGTMNGDTLVANYTFNSEGVESVRQVAFIRKNKTLTEGYGESEEVNRAMVFKDLSQLNFSNSTVLTEIPCRE